MAPNKMDLKWLSSGMGIDRQTESQSSQEAASIIELGGVIKSFVSALLAPPLARGADLRLSDLI